MPFFRRETLKRVFSGSCQNIPVNEIVSFLRPERILLYSWPSFSL